MPFVHGHARDAGWVVSHFRRPQRAGSEQLDLDDPEALPEPRSPAEDDEPAAATDAVSDAGE